MRPLYLGMGPPYVVRVVVPATPTFDPLVAAAAALVTLEVTAPSGQESQWSASVLNSSASSVTVQHSLALGELNERGRWLVWARFLLSTGGVLRTEVGALPVVLAANQPTH